MITLLIAAVGWGLALVFGLILCLQQRPNGGTTRQVCLQSVSYEAAGGGGGRFRSVAGPGENARTTTLLGGSVRRTTDRRRGGPEPQQDQVDVADDLGQGTQRGRGDEAGQARA